MQIYGLKTCDTCRKALKILREHDVSVEYLDVRADGLPGEFLDEILSQHGLAAINKASTTWRAMSDDDKASDVRDLLVKQPTLLRRPAIRVDGNWTLGWKADVQARYLG